MIKYKTYEMKKLVYLTLLLPLIMGCNSMGTNSAKDIAIVEQYIRAVENLDYTTMTSLLDDNYQGFGPSYTDSINKQQAIEAWKYNVENLYEKIRYTREQNASTYIKEGNNRGEWVSSWAELNITYKSGETVVIWSNTAYRVENSKIVKTFTFYNEADALRQLGYIFL